MGRGKVGRSNYRSGRHVDRWAQRSICPFWPAALSWGAATQAVLREHVPGRTGAFAIRDGPFLFGVAGGVVDRLNVPFVREFTNRGSVCTALPATPIDTTTPFGS